MANTMHSLDLVQKRKVEKYRGVHSPKMNILPIPPNSTKFINSSPISAKIY